MADFSALDLLAIALAAQALVDVWHNGSNLAEAKAVLQAKADSGTAATTADAPLDEHPLATPLTGWRGWLYQGTPRVVAEMLSCSFCMSHHTPWLLLLAWWLAAPLGAWGLLLRIPIYSLAMTRVSTLVNAVAPDGAKYERSD